MHLKQYILLGSTVGTLIAYVLFNTKDFGVCNIYCGSGIDTYQTTFLAFPLILIFSLITYILPAQSFVYWWKFAKVAIPAMLVVSLIIAQGFHHSPGGWFNMNDEVDIVMMTIVFLVFFIGSVAQIIRGYRRK